MPEPCTWPAGCCQHWAAEQEKPDPFGRVWMHCEEGLTLTKASMGRFLIFCLSNNVEVGQVHAFDPRYARSLVLATVRLRPEQFPAFEAATGAKLRRPPTIHLNSGHAPA